VNEFAVRVVDAVCEHARRNDGYYGPPGNQETALVDFVTDLRHLAARDGVDFGNVIRLSEMHYLTEGEV
jgi:hypothetical protein